MAGTGGKREGSGRKPRKTERDLHKKLSPYEKDGLKALIDNVKAGEAWAVKMYFDYYFGKPTEKKEIKIDRLPKIDLSEWE